MVNISYKFVGLIALIIVILGAYIGVKREKIWEQNELEISKYYVNKENEFYSDKSVKTEYINFQNVKENKNKLEKTEINVQDDVNKMTIKGKDTIKNEIKNPDMEVISYMNETEKLFSDTNYKDEIKKRFIIIIDFLFYDGKLKNYTLDDLSKKAKLQVLKIALSIDTKIEKYFPGYKESISKTTGNIYI